MARKTKISYWDLLEAMYLWPFDDEPFPIESFEVVEDEDDTYNF